MYIAPTVSDFKNYFVRDFTYGVDISTTVTDGDLSRALAEALAGINAELFPDQATYSGGFLLLSAHNLVLNLKAVGSSCSGQAQWLIQSKGAGSVSESFAIPEIILKNPYYAWLSKTTYGNKYLMLVYPILCGQVFISDGGTSA